MKLKKMFSKNRPEFYQRLESKYLIWIREDVLDIGIDKRFIIANSYIKLYESDKRGDYVEFIINKKSDDTQ